MSELYRANKPNFGKYSFEGTPKIVEYEYDGKPSYPAIVYNLRKAEPPLKQTGAGKVKSVIETLCCRPTTWGAYQEEYNLELTRTAGNIFEAAYKAYKVHEKYEMALKYHKRDYRWVL